MRVREGFLVEGVVPQGASEDEKEEMKRSSQWAEWDGGGDALQGPVRMRRGEEEEVLTSGQNGVSRIVLGAHFVPGWAPASSSPQHSLRVSIISSI